MVFKFCVVSVFINYVSYYNFYLTQIDLQFSFEMMHILNDCSDGEFTDVLQCLLCKIQEKFCYPKREDTTVPTHNFVLCFFLYNLV